MRIFISGVLVFSVLAFAASGRASGQTIQDLSGHGHTGTYGVGFAGATIPTLNNGYLTFSKPTDTILQSGNVSLANQITYEAVIRLSSTSYAYEGNLWGSWQDSAQDTRLSIGNGGTVVGYANPVNFPNPFSGGDLLTNTWYNIAYVYDGNQERIYIDGLLTASRSGSGNAQIGPSNTMTVGAIFRDGSINPAFDGDLMSLRISDTARYSGSSYTPEMTYFGNDAATEILYDFVPEPSMAMLCLIVALSLACRRHRRQTKLGSLSSIPL